MLVYADRVLETSTSTGTGPFTLAGAVRGYQRFAQAERVGGSPTGRSPIQIGDTVYYSAWLVDGLGNPSGTWETGRGTYSAANTLTRTTVLASADGGAPIDFGSGTKYVMLGVTADFIRDGENAFHVRRAGAQGNSNLTATGGADDYEAFLDLLQEIDVQGGGDLIVDDGYYRIDGGYLPVPTNCRILMSEGAFLVTNRVGGGGANAGDSLRDGSMLFSEWPSNASTLANVEVIGGNVVCHDPANAGAAFYDNGGSWLRLRTKLFGFKFGAVLDQSELVVLRDCYLSPDDTGGAGLWIVNGGSLRVGNLSGVTNIIKTEDCQVNAGGTVIGILDDGGDTHTNEGNNYNGCLHHGRFAGVGGLSLGPVGQCESAVGANFVFTNTALDGHTVGQCDNVVFYGPLRIVPTGTNQCAHFDNAGSVVMIAPVFGNTTSAKVTGTGNINSLFSFGAINGGGGATFDAMAANHWELGNTGSAITVRTNISIPTSPNISTDFTVQSDGTNAGVSLNRSTSNGFFSIYNAAGVRQGYMGFLSGSQLELHAEGSATGWKITGTCTITGNISAANLSGANTGDQFTNVATATVIARSAAGSGAASAHTLGPVLNLSAGVLSVTSAKEWLPQFTAAGDIYIPAAVAMTIDQGNAKIGTGTITFAKSTSAAPGTFNSTTLPATLQAGAWLKVSAASITGFVATHLKRTA